MASIIWADVIAHAAELSSAHIVVRTDALAFANARVSSANHDGEDGPTTRLARIYLAAHYVASNPSFGGGAGPVTSESEGGLSRSYAVASSTAWDALGSTAWGRKFSALGRGSRARAGILL